MTASHEDPLRASGDLHIAYEVLDGPVAQGSTCCASRPSSPTSSTPISCRRSTENFERLAALGRLISYDNRGTGLSDRLRGLRLPSIEERMDDLRVVLDAAGSERAVLVCFADGGPLGCLFAATYPERTVALVLCNTRPRIAWAPDYPWGMRPETFERELARIELGWGTRALAEANARALPWEGVTYDEHVNWLTTEMRLSAGPGDAATAFRMHYESDVRDVLSRRSASPTLVLSRGGEMETEARAFAALIPGARHIVMPGTAPVVVAEHRHAYFDEIERFVRELRDEETELESVLATVLFTDIVGSTARQAALGDRRWEELVHSHHRVVRWLPRPLPRARARHGGRRLLRRVRRAGPCDPLRAGDRAAVHEPRDRGARGLAHRRVPDDRRQGRRPGGLDRCPRDSAARMPPRSSSRRPSRISSPAPASTFAERASTSSRACPERGRCTRWREVRPTGIAATPGSSLPSSSSSDAPPPVDTHETLSASPSSWTARTESPPPTTV